MEHLFSTCDSVLEIYEQLRLILYNFLQRPVSFNDIIHFSFNHRNKKKLVCALSRNKAQILREIVKEIDWNLRLNRKLGSVNEILILKQEIEVCLTGIG